MQLSTRLDCDLVAVETADELTLLIELTAPTPSTTAVRPPATLQIVLDRSGSMSGGRLEAAKTALLSLVDRLDPQDNLGIVAFDDQVVLVVPAGPLTDKLAVKMAISAIEPGGSTDLSAGYLRGLQEARRVSGPTGATLLLISDGHANAGITDPNQLGKVAVEAQTHRVTTSALGLGLGYDETLISALARGGAGNELFAEEADTATALIAGEIDGLLEQVAQATSLRVVWTPAVAGAVLLNELPFTGLPDGFVVELGSFYAAETRRLVLTLQIPGIAALGLQQVATVELMHVALPGLTQHTTSVPIYVNVVPGDQAAGRIPDPVVRTEALFQRTQQAKRRSSRLLAEGRTDEASSLLRQTSQGLIIAAGSLPPAFAAELNAEAGVLDGLAEESLIDSSRASKFASYSSTMGSRTRGRRTRGGSLLLRWANGHEDVEDAVLLLEEYAVIRLGRELTTELRAALRPSSNVRAEAVAAEIAHLLGAEHPHQPFFAVAAFHGGFTVERV